jgi:hypothetical protein
MEWAARDEGLRRLMSARRERRRARRQTAEKRAAYRTALKQ